MATEGRSWLRAVLVTARTHPWQTAAGLVIVAIWLFAIIRVAAENNPVEFLLFLLALGAIAVADLFPTGFMAWLREAWPWLAAMTGIGIVVMLDTFTDRTGSPQFYEAAAQIIPVLLLALALEVRLVLRPAGVDLRLGMIVVGLLAGGELAALQSIERGHGGDNQFSFTVGALAAGVVAISLIALTAGGPPQPTGQPDDGPTGAGPGRPEPDEPQRTGGDNDPGNPA